MAELVASIIGISDAALRLSTGLYQVAKVLKSAGQEVRAIATETSQFSRTLAELSRQLSDDIPAVVKARNVAEDVIASCLTIQQDGEKLLQILNPLVEQSKSQMSRMFLRVRWLFERSKFAYHRDMLGSLKTTLQLLISVVILETVPSKDGLQRLVDEVVNFRHTVEDGIFNIEQHLQTAQLMQAFQPRNMLLPNITSTESGGRLAIEGPPGQRLSISEVQEGDGDSGTEAQDSSLAGTGGQLVESNTSLGDADGDVDGSDSMEPVGPLALAPYFRAYFVQEKVCHYSNQALYSAGYDKDGTALPGPAGTEPGTTATPGMAPPAATAGPAESVKPSEVSSLAGASAPQLQPQPQPSIHVEAPRETVNGAAKEASKEVSKEAVNEGLKEAPREAGAIAKPAAPPTASPTESEPTAAATAPPPPEDPASGPPPRRLMAVDEHLGLETPDLYGGGDDDDDDASEEVRSGTAALLETPLPVYAAAAAAATRSDSALGLAPTHDATSPTTSLQTLPTTTEQTQNGGDARLRPETPTSQTLSPTGPDVGTDYIYFITHEGEKLPVPFDECDSYDNLRDALLKYGFQYVKSPFWKQAIEKKVFEQHPVSYASTYFRTRRAYMDACFLESQGFQSLDDEVWDQRRCPDISIRMFFHTEELQSRFGSRTVEQIRQAEIQSQWAAERREREEKARKELETRQIEMLRREDEKRIADQLKLEKSGGRLKGLFRRD